jgi:YgiT-type zinc finger domain-containing protein
MMADHEQGSAAGRCPRCGGELTATMVRSAVWRGDSVAIIEDIPALVCSGCLEQFYDDDVSEAMRRLAENGFPPQDAVRQVTVPVFSLAPRVRRRAALPEDSFVD